MQDHKLAALPEGEADTESINVLGVCPAAAGELGRKLEGVLNEVRNVNMVRLDVAEEFTDGRLPFRTGKLAKFEPGLILLCSPGKINAGSEALFGMVRKAHPELSVIMILEMMERDDFRSYMKLGAADFCLMPLRLADLVPRLYRWSVRNPKPGSIVRELEQKLGLRQLVGESQAFLEVVNKIPKFAQATSCVLITGETGTGKEMCARAVHQLGPRAGHPFIAVNCGAIPADLIENELFGHDAGAFTGAGQSTQGLLHDAEGGTLFLDEIDSLPLQAQVKFLRFLQEKNYRPLGSRKVCKADVRIVVASNANLEESVRVGNFRADLFYRVNILTLRLPALRERRDDIPALARHFAAKHSGNSPVPARDISEAALEKLLAYSWPGNVRELENTIERAVVLADQPRIFSGDICLPGSSEAGEDRSFKFLKARSVAEFEAAYVRHALAASDGNISKAARFAKKNRRAFWQLMHKHGISPPVAPPASSPGQMKAGSMTNLS